MAIIRTLTTPEELAHKASLQISSIYEAAINDHGYFSLVLSGGDTPRATYEELATLGFAEKMNWEKIHVFWGDERCVPPDNPKSNYRLAFDSMLMFTSIPETNIHRIRGELNPKEAANIYQNDLLSFFSKDIPRFDLVLLGLGNDGHTASIFPGSKIIYEDTLWVAATYVRKLRAWRITMTPLIINTAKNVIFLVSGSTKSECLHQVLSSHYQPEVLPAQAIRPDQGQLYWFIDSDAATRL
jgi:6-phosphogluconolactonase